jgi:chemotaxis protein methyltransferase CheR
MGAEMITVSASESKSINNDEYTEFCSFLESTCGIVLGDNKQYLVNSRLKRLLRDHQIESVSDLISILRSNNNISLKEHTIDAMTTNETSWFRDSYPYDVLKNDLIPEIASRGNRDIKIWSSACSSGQEPYSIAMVIQEYKMSRPGSLSSASILATDISPSMLKEAKEGYFDNMSIARGLSDERKKMFFTLDGSRWKTRDTLKESITFKESNLMNSFAIHGKFDVIFCRNVLIYFSLPLKKDIIERMSQCLNPGGYLIMGGTESVSNYTDKYEAVRYQNGLVYRIK